MNGDPSSWSVTGSDLGDFIAAFRHIADLAHAFTGATIKVDWSPSADPDNASAVQYQDLYPGDLYVDVVVSISIPVLVSIRTTPSFLRRAFRSLQQPSLRLRTISPWD
jgi:hypothetical protein